MYYKNGTWVGFSREVFESMKAGFLENKPIIEVSIEGSQYLIDFFRMLQIDLVTGNRRSISWIDVNKKCFFPKFTVDEKSHNCCEVINCPEVKIEIKIDQNSVKRKRNRSYSDEVESDESSSDDQYSVSKRPRIPSLVMENARWPNVEILKDGERNYLDIKHIFLSGLRRTHGDITVTSIHRCLHAGPIGSARLQSFQKQIELTKATRGTAEVRIGWHGTSSEGVANIMLHGFGLSNKLSGSEAAYGDGIYLSPARAPETSALLSVADKNGEKHMLLCRVIMGNIEKVEVGSNQFHSSSAEYDTGVDNFANPKWYIVWSTHMNRHILPEYVVSYKSSDHQQGQGLLTGTPTPTPIPMRDTASTMSFPKLFSAMKSSLPSSSSEELEALFRMFKEGKVAKDVLIKRLRSIAGDQLITSTIRKIRTSMC
ncbi:WWE domain [Macleaya cordata]|uniref:WWE domain n=1 Tax=Macleaya cordata TaxID=56857 RepID=A0A200R181_MACCD|nr:WWE domain [Macleaya cordata]